MKQQKTVDIEKQNYMMTLKLSRVASIVMSIVISVALAVLWVASIQENKIGFAVHFTVLLAPFAVSMLYLTKICKILKDGDTPFRLAIAKYINHISLFLMGGGFIGYLITPLSVLEVDLGGLTFGFFIGYSAYCWIGTTLTLIAYAFKYGCKLQQESDETI